MADKKTLEILLKLQDQLSKGIKSASKNVVDMGSKIEATSKKLNSMSTSMTSVGKKAAVGFAAGAAAIGGITAVFAGYEKQMSKVKAISGATEDQFELLKETARDLGATTKFSAIEAGQGMEFLALAGYDTNQAIEAMPGLLNLAAAGQLDLGKAADLTTDILSQYGLTAEYATTASDVFAKAQASSNTNVELLGSALLSVGGTAKNFGLTLEDTTAFLGKLADQGLKGSAAGTALNRMMLDFIKNEPDMRAMGIAVFDNAGN
ncbi:phage tail tape measure protein, partial [Candidatus Babeliales bacterium]|nr:phage tail tape measure protein [Candidatus Babeliales bacterium]